MKNIFMFLFVGSLAFTNAIASAGLAMSRGVKGKDFESKFVEVRPGTKLYVEQKLAAPGKPTLFMANGLTYSTTQWDALVTAIESLDPDVGIVLYDMVGMGKTLLAHAPVNYDIPFDNQVLDLKYLVDHLKVAGPVTLVGLSYGGAVALSYMTRFADDFEQAIVMSPFLAKIPAQDEWVKNRVALNHLLYPWDPRTDRELYEWYLRYLITATFPLAEPVILENPYKLEGVYRMVKGSLDWDAFAIADRLPKGKLHLMIGENDEYVPAKWQQEFWAKVPESARASNLFLTGAKHKFPEDSPLFTASWILDIVHHKPNLFDGRSFIGDPRKGTVTPEGPCEAALRNDSATR